MVLKFDLRGCFWKMADFVRTKTDPYDVWVHMGPPSSFNALLPDRSLTAYEVSTVKGSDLASRHNPELMQAVLGPPLDPYEVVLAAMVTSNFVVSHVG